MVRRRGTTDEGEGGEEIMPYNIPESKGGDSDENVEKMERCVNSVIQDGDIDEEMAIAICKSHLGFTKDGKEE